MAYQIIGPAGAWHLVAARGAVVNRTMGKVGDTLLVTPAAGPVVDIDIELEHQGDAVVSSDGAVGRAGDPYRFRLRRFLAPIDWKVQAFAWDSLTDPRQAGDRHRAAFKSPPLATRRDGLHTQVDIGIEEGLNHESSIHCDELMSLPKSSLTSFIGSLTPAKQALLDRALAFALSLTGDTFPEGVRS